MDNSKLSTLVELGLLCRGDSIPASTGDSPIADSHVYRNHHQLLRYQNHNFQYPFADRTLPAYELLPESMTMKEAMGRTRCICLLGASDTPQLRRCLENPDTITLIFEPDEAVLATFLETVSPAFLAAHSGFIFSGDPYTLNPSLQDSLPANMFKQGPPAVFQTGRIATEYDQWAASLTEYLEILHFRHAVHPICGQNYLFSRPLRTIKRGLTYDQQLHLYENIPDYLTCPDISALENVFDGHTAILVAAGPELPDAFDYIRANRSRAVVICVNNALKPLAEAGIRPHFTVINDTSLDSGEVFRHVPPLPGTILVGHCLSDLGHGLFGKKFIMDDHKSDTFGERPTLDNHGSVISTAFSLARHMGCTRCVIVGAQLASRDPWRLAYAKGATNHTDSICNRPLIHESPQLYPVSTPFRHTLYTTLNFRDAALWLTEEIRLSGIECINTSKESILYGRGITHDPEPAFDGEPVNQVIASLFQADPPRINRAAVDGYVKKEIAHWAGLKHFANELLQDETVGLALKGAAIREKLDANNTTFLLERSRSFRNDRFHGMAFSDDPLKQAAGYRYYFEQLQKMCANFQETLARSEQMIRYMERA